MCLGDKKKTLLGFGETKNRQIGKKMKKITLILLLIVGAGMSQEKHYGYEYIKESGDIKEYHMTSNGLKVLLKEDHSAPVATFMVTYEVGSRNEAIGYTCLLYTSPSPRD